MIFKSLDCLEQTIKNMDIKGDLASISERIIAVEKSLSSQGINLWLYYHEQNVDRNMNVKGDSPEVTDGNANGH